ncbi:hypothetical protein TH63_11600 [Rufibacter radiotolerans]|uniref:Lipoprotein n=1 Tax=Rufibacter radiotolerans TaxID=1379910 RepID=A0A0H4W6T3_9BACT|nr:hypothetical protein [Rufibacter radiotolerans]AKQ46131.1 hypothetical protein TH63_11600 [Rufibacter radiotolerans]
MDLRSFKTLGAATLFLLLGSMACERTSPTNQNPENQPRTRAEKDLAEFREWVDEKTNKADSTTAQNWPEVKEEFKQRSAQLEERADSLSKESKAEYKELRRRFENWETRNQQRSQVPLHPETLARFEQELFGAANALESNWTAAQMREIYTQFVQNVRARRASWTASDWDYVDEIYRQLNLKKDQVEAQIPGKDKLKIKSLQAEYLTLETGKDAKDLLKEFKKDGAQ